jgi:hypothetical protein
MIFVTYVKEFLRSVIVDNKTFKIQIVKSSGCRMLLTNYQNSEFVGLLYHEQ